MNKNYAFYMKTDISGYIGKWIAICNNEIVASGKNVKKVFEEAKSKHPNDKPLLARVPNKETMIL